MKYAVYYNEHEPFAAQWLRNLIAANLIALGDVDERSIEEIAPDDLAGYTQCHFFAGIGVWSYALRRAGWSDETPVWTGSCPCQSFSASGKGEGFSDKRHLWPTWFRLIREHKPHVIFGEQVSAKDGLAWFDVVSSDLEDAGYRVGALDSSAASVGAPHVRQRLYFVADCAGGVTSNGILQRSRQYGRFETDSSAIGDVADSQSRGRGERGDASFAGSRGHADSRGELGNAQINGSGSLDGESGQSGRQQDATRGSGVSRDMANTERSGRDRRRSDEESDESREVERPERFCSTDTASLTNGFWRDAEWLYCQDGKYRPTKPGLFPLAHGITGRLGKLRAAGNALVAPQTEEFIRSYRSVLQDEGR